jgi:hypothetical protein
MNEREWDRLQSLAAGWESRLNPQGAWDRGDRGNFPTCARELRDLLRELRQEESA